MIPRVRRNAKPSAPEMLAVIFTPYGQSEMVNATHAEACARIKEADRAGETFVHFSSVTGGRPFSVSPRHVVCVLAAPRPLPEQPPAV